MSKLYNIKNLTRQNLRAWMAEKSKRHSKVQDFRADQVFYWLYQQQVESFSEMKNIGGETRKIMKTAPKSDQSIAQYDSDSSLKIYMLPLILPSKNQKKRLNPKRNS